MAKSCMAGAGSVIETAKLIKTEMLERGKVPPVLRAEVYHVQDGVGVALFVFERYYMRTSGFTSLTVAVTGDNEAVYVDGIGAGGGGMMEAIWSTEDKLLKTLIEILKERGFEEFIQEEK